MDKQKFQTAIAFAVPILLAAALVAVCVWSVGMQKEAEEERAALARTMEAAYQENLYQLSDNINDMQTSLNKLRVTGSTAQHVMLLSNVWRLSGAAVTNLSNLPASHVDTAEMNQFIVRVGDYCNSLTKRILNGGVLTYEDYATIDSLYEAGVRIGNELKSRIDSGDFPVSAMSGEGYYTTLAGGQGESAQPSGGGASEPQEEDAQSQEGESEDKGSISDYPTLIYDGPFSESNEEAAPAGLPAYTVEEAKAKEIALHYLGGGALEGSGLEEGTIPVYGFYGTDSAGRKVEITVSQQGGMVDWMMAETPAGADGVPEEAIVQKMREAAQAYLDDHGYDAMEATYAQFYDGIGIFNFAATQEDVILYSDLVKVYVEQTTCQVAGIDANNYLMRHTRRTLPQVQLAREEAEMLVNESLSVASVRLALIPKTASTEALCYEFKGSCVGTDFIVYINAVTGNEEEIYEIINSQEGQLVV